jgi:hypothetical protein
MVTLYSGSLCRYGSLNITQRTVQQGVEKSTRMNAKFSDALIDKYDP